MPDTVSGTDNAMFQPNAFCSIVGEESQTYRQTDRQTDTGTNSKIDNPH